jgi:hypothetical protein
MNLSRPALASLSAALALAGSPGFGSEPAVNPPPAKPPVSFAPPRPLLSQVEPGQRAPAVPEVSFPSVETLIGEIAAAAPPGEESLYDPDYGIRAHLPQGWKVRASSRSTTPPEVQFVFEVVDYPLAGAFLHYKKFAERRTLEKDQMKEWLEREALVKAKKRFEEGRTDYKVRKGVLRNLSDRPAMSWLADYTFLGERWIEFISQIHTLDGVITLTVNAPARNMAVLFTQIETIAQSTTIP